MKKVLLLCLGAFMLFGSQAKAQDDFNTITTGVPFLIIAADARASGMGALMRMEYNGTQQNSLS